MLKTRILQIGAALVAVCAGLTAAEAPAQVQIGGDFMLRAYWDRYSYTMDDRDDLKYMRHLGRLYLDAPVGQDVSFHADLVTISDNPVLPVRNFAGSGLLYYGVSQIYVDLVTPKVPLCDLARFRFGRQHYELGQGLTLGDSYYQLDDYDGIRADFSRGNLTVGVLGAITEQEITDGGYYPLPGNDQIYVAKVEYALYDHTLLAYSVYDKRRGDFNDNIVTGCGANGSIATRNLRYFGEVASQTYNQPSGLPEKGGMAYMAGISYSWAMGPFRTVKVEVRGAGYQGDDASTSKVEIFEPYYPSWFWGDRTAYANGTLGGDYPHRGIQPEGSRIWYGRIYFSPTAIPKARLQFQYAAVSDWVNNDGIDEPDDEFGVKLYYQLNANVRLQGRYMRRIANSGDEDVNGSGTITSIEDRHNAEGVMFEFRVQF